MKRIALVVALLAGIAAGQTTTSVTGTIKDLTGANVTSGKVTFTLAPSRDTTISGLARFSPQTVTCPINGSGLIKALDGVSTCTITMNTALNPPGSYYVVGIWPYNVKTSTFTFYAVLSSYDWSTVVPTPTTSPAQNFVDIFSNQTIGGNKTWSGTHQFNGPVSFPGGITGSLGTVNASIINKTVYVDGIINPTIASAIADCPAAPAGCHVIVPFGSYTSPGFTLGVAPCQVDYAQVLDVDVGVQITFTGQVHQLCGGYIRGGGRDGTRFTADPAFPASTPLIEMGDNVNAIDARISDVDVNCNQVTGCTGIRARGLNENSYIGRDFIEGYLTNGVLIDGTMVNTANFVVEDNAFSVPAAISGDMMSVVNAGAITFLRNTFNSTVQQATAAGIHFSGTTMTIQAPSVLNGNTHCEKINDCVLVDGKANLVVLGADGENGVVNTIHVAAAATGQVQATGPLNNANNGAKLIIKNDVTGTTITSLQPNGAIPNYEWQLDALSESWTDSGGFHPRRRAFANLGTPANGTQLFCTDCNSTCTAGASTGRTCFRENGAWTH